MAVLTSFPKFVDGLPIQATLRALFWTKSLTGGELSDFLGDLSVDDVFKIVIVQ